MCYWIQYFVTKIKVNDGCSVYCLLIPIPPPLQGNNDVYQVGRYFKCGYVICDPGAILKCYALVTI